ASSPCHSRRSGWPRWRWNGTGTGDEAADRMPLATSACHANTRGNGYNSGCPHLEASIMSVTVAGFVKNGVVVPNAPLPEGAQVEIHMAEPAASAPAARITPAELRRLPREQRQAILAAAAELAEEDYRSDKELTGFEAFSEEEMDDE